MDLDLSGKRALVCGASAGIGRACAVELAALGASVTLAARNAEKLAAVRASLPVKPGQTHDVWVVDLSKPAAVRAEVGALLARGGAFHILINNTGGPTPGRAIDTAPEAFVAGFESLLLTPHVLVQALAPGMGEAKYGRIINITSTSVKQPIPNLAVSNAVRAATANWAKNLSQELGPLGITVNNILPGYTDTERLTEIFEARAKRTNSSADAAREETIGSIPVGRLGRPEEIAAAVAFLASPAAAYISGINMPVDGGRLATL
ncbi:MAG TPA: SDR family oxidoreductase [Phycisphaerales bacterium]|nr:SDR family oxidoreductase [Phycisphaerales bacterium]